MARKVVDRQGPWVWNRRAFLTAGAALVAWPVLGRPASAFARRRVALGDNPFTTGIASGDPSADGFVLWTRLAPKPLEGGGMPQENVEVRWEVAADDSMKRILQHGSVVATPEMAHTVHVEVNGLEPDRWYWYRFFVGDEVSAVGRARTMPAADQLPERLRFSFASCQHFETGLYTAYEHMVRDDLDLILHLGDYIYEGGATSGRVRQHVGPELMTLEDYRNRHAQYKTDAFLQSAHQLCPWLVVWDDHEFDNNCAGDNSEEPDVSKEDFLRRRANAYQAYYEHMPLRRASIPVGPNMQLYRRITFGRLADFSMLDTRQYRSDQPCGDRTKEPCEEVFDPKATMLGDAQEKWLCNGLVNSQARWNILGQQVMMGRADRKLGEGVAWSMDQWSGYDVPRQRLMKFLADRKIANPIVLTGDIHSNWANELLLNFDDPSSQVVATEFVGTSISSGGSAKFDPKLAEAMSRENPFVKFHSTERGYVRCEFTPDACRADYQAIPDVSSPGGPQETRASFVVESGKPGLERV